MNDIPIPARFEELEKRFPDAKFIYTARELSPWLNSCEKHFSKSGLRGIKSFFWKLKHSYFEKYRLELYKTKYFDREHFEQTYIEHEKKVFAYFKNKKNKLLVMEITKGDGWKKLCPFLGEKIPYTSFPHKNIQKYNTIKQKD